MNVLNAPGTRPSKARVEMVARTVLSLEDDDPAPSDLVVRVLTAFLTDNPGDNNFLLELAEKPSKNNTDTGFGSITCMEDDCWTDILLTADPDVRGGKHTDDNGCSIGSMWEYAVHCRTTPGHIAARNKRLQNQKLDIPAGISTQSVSAVEVPAPTPIQRNVAGPLSKAQSAAPSQAQPSSSRHNVGSGLAASTTPLASNFASSSSAASPALGTPHAGPSAPSARVSQASQRGSTAGPSWQRDTMSSPLRDYSVNRLDDRTNSSKSNTTVVVDSDSDEEILFVGRKSPTKKQAFITLLDDDENEVKFNPQSSQSTKGQASSGTSLSQNGPRTPGRSSLPSSQQDVKPKHIQAWALMTLRERREAMAMEDKFLGAIRKPPTHIASTFKHRVKLISDLQLSGGMAQWTPPNAELLKLYPSYPVHPALEGSFERQAAVGQHPAPGVPLPPLPSTLPGSFAAAGPSSMPGAFPTAGPSSAAGPSTPKVEPGFGPNNLSPMQAGISDAVWKATWDALPAQTRAAFLHAEMNATKLLLGDVQQWSTRPAIRVMLFHRSQELLKMLVGKSHWVPAPILLSLFPTLRTPIHPELRKYLPVHWGGRGEIPGGLPGLPGLPGFGAGGLGGAMAPEDLEELGMEWDRPIGSDLHTFFQDALEDFKEDATVEDGLKILKLEHLTDKLPGATFQLMPHQVLGVAFMIKRELRESGSRGGLLCDAMGLGKTVQCIALMLSRDKRPSDFKKCPQLIVAPLALLQQWKAEIDTKTTTNWRVLIHHGGSRPKSSTILKQYDIILTTYGTLVSESGLKTQQKKVKKDDDLEDDLPPPPKKRPGPLFGVKWFRVILDEGHMARNRNTRTARAIDLLEPLHAWVLTGTPIVNSLGDLGPALAFIGMDSDDFQKRIARIEKKKPRLAAKRCQALLRPLMMRRNKDSELNGRKILELPPKITNLASLMFETDERAVYAAIEQRARVRVNRFIQRGTLMKNYSVVLVLLTRLRQCVNHPWLLRRRPGEIGSEEDLVVDDDAFGADLGQCRASDSDEYGRAVAMLGPEVVDTLKKRLEERYQKVTSEVDETDSSDMDCSICYEPFDGTELITPCGHAYCKGCMQLLFSQPVRDGAEMQDEQVQRGCRPCPMCRAVLEPGKVFRAAAIFKPPQDEKPDIEEEEEEEEQVDRKGKKRALPAKEEYFEPRSKRARAAKKAEDEEEDELMDEGGERTIPPSTKMRHLLALVQGYLAENPNAKILVFSQFVQFLDLLGDFLALNDIRSIDYRGSMRQSARDDAIRRFATPPEISQSIPIMLISTKAGGVGLNLTMATKVIMCDLAWNPATENQAVDRAHRIGQTSQVNVERLVISDTVEDRLMEIQKRKGLLADGAMGEGDIGRLGRLTMEDIKRLFAIDRDWDRNDE